MKGREDKKKRLLSLGMELALLGERLEEKKDQLRTMMARGEACSDAELLRGYSEYQETKEQWDALEREFLALREKLR